MDVRSLFAAQARAQTLSQPATPFSGTSSASDMMMRGVTDFADTLKEAEGAAQAAMAGTADPHALVAALAQSELAVETAVTLRDRVVEAYQEILRMPV